MSVFHECCRNVLWACALALATVGASTVTASCREDGMPPVVSTGWLSEHLQDEDLVLLHLGREGSHARAHIPGARSATLRTLLRVNDAGIRDEMLPEAEIAATLSALGVGDQSKVVVYFEDERGFFATARYLLTLEYAGMAGRAAYLDGGLPKWRNEGRPVEKGDVAAAPSEMEVVAAHDVIVDKNWLAMHIEDDAVTVLDGRPPDSYAGRDDHWDRPGHISGATNIPFFTLLEESPPYLLKQPDALSAMFTEAGVGPDDTVVVYCGTGLWASPLYLAARLLGYEVRLYDGSFQEWSADPSLPIIGRVDPASLD